MAVLVIAVLLITVAALVAYMVWIGSVPLDGGTSAVPEVQPTEAELLQARLDLHRVERGVDVALAKREQQREAEAVKQAIAEALRDA